MLFFKVSFPLVAAFIAAGLQPSAAQQADSDGCYQAPNHCIQATKSWRDSGRVLSLRVTNTCSSRLYVKFCVKKATGTDDCGAGGLAPGATKVWTTHNADARQISGYRYIGSKGNSSDWVCSGRDKSWNDPVY